MKRYDTINLLKTQRLFGKLRTTKDAFGKYTAELRDKNIVAAILPLLQNREMLCCHAAL